MERRLSPTRPTVLDEQERIVKGTIVSRDSRVRRQGIDGPFVEILDPAGVVMDGASVPVLNAHRADSTAAVLGSAYDLRIEDGELQAMLQFSSRQGVSAVWEDVKAGHLTRLSVGYDVIQFADSEDPRTGERVRTVTRWRVREISLVPLAADAGAAIRMAGETMPDDVKKKPVETPADASQGVQDAPPANTRAETNRTIRSLVEKAGLAVTVANDLIDREATVEEARGAVLDQVLARPQPAAQISNLRINQVGESGDDPDVMLSRMADALASRMDPSHKPAEAAEQYLGRTLPECQRDLWAARGDPTAARLSNAGVFQRAATHGTSDFPILLQSTGNRVMLNAYEVAASAIKSVARRTTISDFRSKTSIRLGDMGRLEKVAEGGEITSTTRAENKEAYALATFGRMFSLTRQAIINDDLGAFADFSTAAGRAAADTEATLLAELLTENSGAGPTMDSGDTLFHANHGNLGAGAALDTAALAAARLAMRKQTGPGGLKSNITPRSLLVPSELETTAETILAAIQPDSVANVNVFSGRLTILVEPRLTDATAYYLFADPAQAPALEYAYLSSASGPQMETQQGWEVLGTSFRVYLDFGAGAIDYRGAFKDPGA